ncbi:4'-phosphopantetheinyl transferase family protein [Testudinibacter sp. P27/CKL/0425]
MSLINWGKRMRSAVIWGNLSEMPSDERLQQALPADLLHKRQHLMARANPRRQQRLHCSLLAHFLLAQLLDTFQLPRTLLSQIQRTASGRPYFANQPQLDFNISHSADWVAVVLAITEPGESAVAVAIDIESPQKTRNFDGLIRFYASDEERFWFAEQPQSEAAFYRTWCLREAVLKSQGVGIVKLRSVCHQPQQLQIQCDYAPRGKLFFTDELPFYLAYFVQQNNENPPELFYWQDRMISANLTKQLIYQVNGDKT